MSLGLMLAGPVAAQTFKDLYSFTALDNHRGNSKRSHHAATVSFLSE